jgi:hypothetical protein
MSEEKQKNDEVTKHHVELFAAALVGFLVSMPVAVWAMGHLFYTHSFLTPDGILPTVLSVLDCLMTTIAFLAFVGVIYYAGTQHALKEIVTELEKPE